MDEIERCNGRIVWWLTKRERVVWDIAPGACIPTACHLEQVLGTNVAVVRRLPLEPMPPHPKWPM